MTYKNKEKQKQWQKEYNNNPEVKAHRKNYWKKKRDDPITGPKLREYANSPEKAAWRKTYYQRPEVKARMNAYYKRPEVRKKINEHNKKKREEGGLSPNGDMPVSISKPTGEIINDKPR